MSSNDLIMVGEASRILHRGADTVLNYERRGLLPLAARQPLTGNRMWPRMVVEALAKRLEVREPTKEAP